MPQYLVLFSTFEYKSIRTQSILPIEAWLIIIICLNYQETCYFERTSTIHQKIYERLFLLAEYCNSFIFLNIMNKKYWVGGYWSFYCEVRASNHSKQEKK